MLMSASSACAPKNDRPARVLPRLYFTAKEDFDVIVTLYLDLFTRLGLQIARTVGLGQLLGSLGFRLGE